MPAPTLSQHVRHPIVAQFFKYGVVGVANTLLSVLIILIGAWIGAWHIAAYAVAYAVGALNGYFINRRWTFNAGPGHGTVAVRYLLVQGAALLASTGLVYLLVDVAALDKVLSQLIAIAVAVTGGFFANRWWTFAHARQERSDLPGVAAASHAGR